MEELQDESYIKQADTVERYLLNIIKQYFVDNVTVPETSRESFIIDALEVMKEEVDFDALGVLSITLPSGETRIGNVEISLEDLDGEPKIPEKHTAFNVDFGDKSGTACEGNDPRLYDARTPIHHTHQISEIFGLEGLLSSAQSKIEAAEALAHTHANKAVLDKLTYTGTKSVIDLSIIDTLEDEVRDAIQQVNDKIQECCDLVNAAIDDINNKIVNLNNRIDDLVTLILTTNAQNLQECKDYTEQVFNEKELAIKQWALNTFASKSEFMDLVHYADDVYIYCATDEFKMTPTIMNTSSVGWTTVNVQISDSIMNELQTRGEDISDAQLDMYFKYIQNGKLTKMPVPCVIYDDENIKGTVSFNIQLTGTNKGLVKLIFNCSRSDIPSNILGGFFVIDAYSKRPLHLASFSSDSSGTS
jgi:hypothetical protein